MLTKNEYAVLDYLSPCIGKENAVRVDVIASALGITGVTVRQVVRHLVTDYGYFIGSSTGKKSPPGYYMIICEDELNATIKNLRLRGIRCLQRAAALDKTSIEKIFKQGVLDLGVTNKALGGGE